MTNMDPHNVQYTWVTVCLAAGPPVSLSGRNGGIGAGDERERVSPGPRVEYTRWDTVKISPPNPSQPDSQERNQDIY